MPGSGLRRRTFATMINYGLGEETVCAHVEAAGPDPTRRWRIMEEIISQPTLPRDLLNSVSARP